MKNRALEFYRFLAIIGIAVFHFNVQFLGHEQFPKGGYLGVEFFFILSGYFLMKTFKRENHPRTAFEFWKKQIKRLYPSFLLMLVVFLLFDIFVRHYIASPIDFLRRIGDEIWDLLMLQDVGIPGIYAYEGSIWFLTSLSINLYVIYYLLLNREKPYKEFMIPVACVLGYGYIGKTFGSLSMQTGWLGGWLYGGLARGFLDMSLGVLTYEMVSYVKRLPTVIVSVAEVIGLVWAVFVLNKGFCVDDFKVLVLFPVLIACADSGKGFVSSKILNNPFSELCGSVSYEIYLDHLLFSTALTMYWSTMEYPRALVLYLACSIWFASAMRLVLVLLSKIKRIERAK